jgi:hypothetical protein
MIFIIQGNSFKAMEFVVAYVYVKILECITHIETMWIYASLMDHNILFMSVFMFTFKITSIPHICTENM